MEIITAISTLIAQKNDLTIYIQNVGEGFERPSFLISHINSATNDLNREVIDNNIFIQIVYYAPWDEYENVDAVNQYTMHDTLKGIFKKGYFFVGDRAVKITQLTGGPRDAEIYLTLNLTITEQKQDDVQPAQVATDVQVNLKGGIE
jgi:hypothetical protein